MIRLGFAEADITPEKPAELVGFYRPDNLSRGVLKPLKAQAAVWEAGERCCLITIDSIGFTKELTNELRCRIYVLPVSIRFLRDTDMFTKAVTEHVESFWNK